MKIFYYNWLSHDTLKILFFLSNLISSSSKCTPSPTNNYGLKMQQFYYTKLMVRLTNISKLKAWNIRKNSRKTQTRGAAPRPHPKILPWWSQWAPQWAMVQCWHNKTHITTGKRGGWKDTRAQMPQIPIFHKHTLWNTHIWSVKNVIKKYIP